MKPFHISSFFWPSKKGRVRLSSPDPSMYYPSPTTSCSADASLGSGLCRFSTSSTASSPTSSPTCSRSRATATDDFDQLFQHHHYRQRQQQQEQQEQNQSQLSSPSSPSSSHSSPFSFSPLHSPNRLRLNRRRRNKKHSNNQDQSSPIIPDLHITPPPPTPHLPHLHFPLKTKKLNNLLSSSESTMHRSLSVASRREFSRPRLSLSGIQRSLSLRGTPGSRRPALGGPVDPKTGAATTTPPLPIGPRIEMTLESPPIVFLGDAETSSGALVSGQFFLILPESSMEFASFRANLRMHVVQKQPFHPNCHDCTHQYKQLHSWEILTKPQKMRKGKHQFPFSFLLDGHLPACMDGRLMTLTYELTAEAIPRSRPPLSPLGTPAKSEEGTLASLRRSASRSLRGRRPTTSAGIVGAGGNANSLAPITAGAIINTLPPPPPPKPIRFEKILSVKRALPVPASQHESVRVFPPTNIKATARYAQTVHPTGPNPLSIRFDGVASYNEELRTMEYWRLKKLVWRIEESAQTVAPACARHGSRRGMVSGVVPSVPDLLTPTSTATPPTGSPAAPTTTTTPTTAPAPSSLTTQPEDLTMTLIPNNPNPAPPLTALSRSHTVAHHGRSAAHPAWPRPAQNLTRSHSTAVQPSRPSAATQPTACSPSPPATPTSSDPPTSVVRTETRSIGEDVLGSGWKAHYAGPDDSVVEVALDYAVRRGTLFACDVASRSGTEVVHQLALEAMFVQERGPVGSAEKEKEREKSLELLSGTKHGKDKGRVKEKSHPTPSRPTSSSGIGNAHPTGVSRVLRMRYAIVLTERAGIGISWDNESPPIYQDVPPSPPSYNPGTGSVAWWYFVAA